METPTKTFRRIVTGHDPEGKATIICDAPPLNTHLVGGKKEPHFLKSGIR